VLSLLAKDVYSIETVESLATPARERLESLGYKNVHVRTGDGYAGWPEEAPFDAIIVTAAPETVPKNLIDQLKDGGRMAIPVGVFFQELLLVVKTGGRVSEQKIADVRFVPMVGKGK
jgi:protein-L-isoaspartate(D-aspartate) O-methyltransferase